MVPGRQKWLILFATIFGTFMAILDATVVNVAPPTMQRVFGADIASVRQVVSVYALALGISIQPTLNVALSVVQGAAVPRASSLSNASRQVAQALGVAILATVLQAHLTGSPPAAPHTGFPPDLTAAMQGLQAAYTVTFVAAIAAWALCFLLPSTVARRPPAAP